jgi:integrase
VPTEEEAIALFDAAPPALQLMMATVELTSMREGDQLALDWTHVEPDVLRAVIGKSRNSNGKVIEWERTPALNDILEAAKTLPGAARVVNLRGAPMGPVFCNRKGRRFTRYGFQSMWRRLRTKLAKTMPSGVDVTYHDWRAWAISRHAGSAKDKADFAGHADPALTMRVYQRLPLRLKPGR